MSIILYFLQAMLIGVAIAAPVGPIGFLCIKRTIESGFKEGFAVGIGAALADATYGLIAAFGLSAVMNILITSAWIIKFCGGILLLYLAYRELRVSVQGAVNSSTTSRRSTLKLIIEVFVLTIANPMTILIFVGIFASISNGPTTGLESFVMVFGIFLGSMIWWIILASIIVKIKHRLPQVWLNYIKYLSAIILAGFGGYTLFSVSIL